MNVRGVTEWWIPRLHLLLVTDMWEVLFMVVGQGENG